MPPLDRKLLRDLRRLWAQSLAIALVLGAGVAILVIAFGAQVSLFETRAAYYERNRFADVFATARRAPLRLVEEITAIPGVQAVEARVAGSVFVVSTGLSVGYVLWLLRGGALIASLLSSLPAWRLVDPLPVLGSMGGRAGDEDDDSLEDLVADDRNAESAPGRDETADNDNAGSVRT